MVRDYLDFPEDAGYFFLTWQIDDEDPEIVCPEIGSAGVGVLATLVGPGDGFDDLFNCEDGSGTTEALPLGEYAIAIGEEQFAIAGVGLEHQLVDIRILLRAARQPDLHA